jgi:hypothetical protein
MCGTTTSSTTARATPNDNPIPGLGQYTVQISAGLAALGAVPRRVQVDVHVTAPNGADSMLTGFRTNYGGQVVRQ